MKKYEEQIARLLPQMTLEEKLGQMRQCGPSLVGAFDVSFEELLNMMFDGKISEDEFKRLMSTAETDYREKDLKAGRIGSYNGIKNAEAANRLQKIAVEETRLGIPLLFGYDVIHGYRSITPIPLAESCAWDVELWEETARMAAKEATAAGVHMAFAPMVDVAKDARWGRISESAGEDAYLTSQYGAAKVRGFQGEDLSKIDAMAACVKHFAAYGAAEAGKDYNRVDMSPQRLLEEYLPPFRACVNAGARALMPAFNDINGVPCSVNKWLLNDLLREDWGFDGILVSDANGIAECVSHGIAANKKEAAMQALQAGLNVDMMSDSYIDYAMELVRDGEIPMEAIDKAVREILCVKFELGLFDNLYQTSQERESAELATEENRRLARKAAEKSIVLLKNENVLPLAATTRLGLVGDLFASRSEMTGAWAIAAIGEEGVSVLDALDARRLEYNYEAGLEGGAPEKAKLEKLAKNCDVLLLALGETKDMSGEAASRADISLPQRQKELLSCACTLGKPVVAVLFNGRPLAMPEVKEKAGAILECWHPGTEAGNAIVNILMGNVNPSAKLTATFPYSSGQCPIYYNHINTGRPGGAAKFTSKYLDAPLEPLYPFGYGLSYTTFEYSDLNVEQGENGLLVTAAVKNSGNVRGEEIVQCYVTQAVAKRVRPVKELKAFKKLDLKPGESKLAALELPYESLGYFDFDMNYRIDDGDYMIWVGDLTQKCSLDRIL